MSFDRTKRTLEIIAAFRASNHNVNKILDIGFGDGIITNSLREHGFDIIGLDITKEKVQQAKNRFPNCDFRHYDGQNIPFDNNTFNTIILNDLMEHVPYDSMKNLMSEIKKVLTIDGLIYISVSNRYQIIEPHTSIPFLTWFPRNFWEKIDRKLNKRNWYNITDIYPYTFRRLRSFCEELKLEYKDFTPVYVIHKIIDLEYVGNRTLRSLIKFFKKVGLTSILYHVMKKFSMIIFVCRKGN